MVKIVHIFLILWISLILAVSLKADDTQIEAFVERLYTNIFAEAGDTTGIAFWRDKLKEGESATEVAKFFYRDGRLDGMNLTDEEFLIRTYLTFFNRMPDSGGFNFWLQEMAENGKLRDQVFYGFALSDEFKDLSESYGVTAYSREDKVKAFVERFYNLTLQRRADEAGLTFWKESLLSREKSASEIAKFFLLSEEFLSKNVSESEFVKITYRALMDREADDDGLAFWIGKLNEGTTREGLIGQFIATEEFKQIEDIYLNDDAKTLGKWAIGLQFGAPGLITYSSADRVIEHPLYFSAVWGDNDVKEETYSIADIDFTRLRVDSIDGLRSTDDVTAIGVTVSKCTDDETSCGASAGHALISVELTADFWDESNASENPLEHIFHITTLGTNTGDCTGTKIEGDNLQKLSNRETFTQDVVCTHNTFGYLYDFTFTFQPQE